jgi:hypothetical protein
MNKPKPNGYWLKWGKDYRLDDKFGIINYCIYEKQWGFVVVMIQLSNNNDTTY